MTFPTPYEQLIYTRTYSRFVDELGRRETWEETVDRYCSYMVKRVPAAKKAEFRKACTGIVNFDVMPSMRALWTAGPALDESNVCAYNCSYLAIDNPRSFAEVLYILLNGTGSGFSVERQSIAELPIVPDAIDQSRKTIVFEDSKLGWAEGYDALINMLYAGKVPSFDFSKVRAKGERLKTFGGRSSGPEPLKQLCEYTVNLFKSAVGRRLTSLECHDLLCNIAQIVVCGGVRRSACISLSNLSDDRMRHAKDGQFWETNPQRMLANNSVAYTEKPSAAIFMSEWLSLVRSNSGERGLFNRNAAQFAARKTGRREYNVSYGTNPCAEIILKSREMCNLSEVVIRSTDTLDDLERKVRQATILGCVQSTLTKFKFLSREWRKNVEEERLLGVSLTGLRDHPVLGRVSADAKKMLMAMKQVALDTAKEWSTALNINMPAAITCVKPSGTVSQLVNSASGIHPRYAPYYIRRIRVSKSDPLAQLLIDQGVKWSPEVGQEVESCTIAVFEFPIESPKNSVFRDETNALEQLEYWLMLKEHWTEHSVSSTIYVSENEWLKVAAWVYDNWDMISGLSFLPYDGGSYQLAPYQEVDELQFKRLVDANPVVDYSKLVEYEKSDNTEGAKSYACSAGGCEI